MTNHFSNHLFYNDQFYKTEADSGTDTIVTYNSKPDLSKVYPYGDIHKSMADYVANSSPIYAPLTVHLSQESTKLDYFATRKCLYEVLQQFGSYYGFTNFLAATFLAAFQRHHLKKSMIKKLYSTNTAEKEDESSNLNGFDTPLDKNQQMYEEDKDMRLKKAITERQSFAYGYWRGYCFELFNNWYCCCCKKREKRKEFLQQDALQKLNREIDILEIVKKLRISSFANELTLKPRQRHLVGFFDDYKLKTPDEKLEQLLKMQNDPDREKRLSMKGH